MVLAAGLGTRLRPLTLHAPKPLCPVGDRPAIDHTLRRLAESGFERAIVNVFHLPEAFDRAWCARQPLEVSVIREAPEILGTAGGIANARDRGLLGEGPLLLWNSDILADIDVKALTAQPPGYARLTIGEIGRPGPVGRDASGTIVRLRKSARAPELAACQYLGVAWLGEACLADLPPVGCLVGDVLMAALLRGERLESHAHAGSYVDLGSTKSYLEANLAWLGDRESFVAAGATVEGSIRRTIVGEGAIIAASVTLDACVVWPGARVIASSTRALIGPWGVETVAV